MPIESLSIVKNRPKLEAWLTHSLNGRFWHWKRTYCVYDSEAKKVHNVALNLIQRLIMPFDSIKIGYIHWNLSVKKTGLISSKRVLDRVIERGLIAPKLTVSQAFEKVGKRHFELCQKYQLSIEDFKQVASAIQAINANNGRDFFLRRCDEVTPNDLVNEGAPASIEHWFFAALDFLLYTQEIGYWNSAGDGAKACVSHRPSYRSVIKGVFEDVYYQEWHLIRFFSEKPFEEAARSFFLPSLEGPLFTCQTLDETNEIITDCPSESQIEALKSLHCIVHGKEFSPKHKRYVELTDEDYQKFREIISGQLDELKDRIFCQCWPC